MLTSGSHRGDVERCRQLGILSYLFKPVRKRELLAAILAALGQSPAASASAAVIKAERPVQAKGLRILLAEDNRVNQIVATRMAEKMGHSVVVAGNGHLRSPAAGNAALRSGVDGCSDAGDGWTYGGQKNSRE